jgi:hypothetical protein
VVSIFFKIKENVSHDKHKLIEYFFNDWIDNTCERQVVCNKSLSTFRVDFKLPQDAVIVQLKGLPQEFEEYLELIH